MAETSLSRSESAEAVAELTSVCSRGFAKIGSIDVATPDSWREPMFLTFDVDWAHDDVIAETIDILEQSDVDATWFVTHDSALLDRLRENPRFELGIHPNFNFLLNGRHDCGRDTTEVVGRLMDLVPEAKCVRSHSVTHGSRILTVFESFGLTHESNHFVPYQTGLVLEPWRCWSKLTRVPYFWEDDAAFLDERHTSMRSLAVRDGIRVFDFHPIHIALNTDQVSRYEEARPFFGDFAKLKEHASSSAFGVREQLLELLGLVECDSR